MAMPSRMLGIADLCARTGVTEAFVRQCVEQQLIAPLSPSAKVWRFDPSAIERIEVAHRMHRQLGGNPVGTSIMMGVLDDLEDLRQRL